MLFSEVDTWQLIVSGVHLHSKNNGASFLPGDGLQIDDLKLKILFFEQCNDLLRMDEILEGARVGQNGHLARLEASRNLCLHKGL